MQKTTKLAKDRGMTECQPDRAAGSCPTGSAPLT